MRLFTLKHGAPSKDLEAIVQKFKDTAARKRIRCPSCRWQPPASARWYCVASGPPENFSSGCGTRWNTFDTAGKCPGCSHQWKWTACLMCGGWALHLDWYEPETEQ